MLHLPCSKLQFNQATKVLFRGRSMRLGLIDTEAFDQCDSGWRRISTVCSISMSAEDASRIAAAVAEGAEVDTSTFIHLASDQTKSLLPDIVRSMGGNVTSIELSSQKIQTNPITGPNSAAN